MPVQVNLPKPEQKSTVVTFQLGNQTYALPITPVRQIIEMVKITSLPQVSQMITGVINFHGVLVPVVNMRRLLEMEEIPFTQYTPIILVNISERLIGLIVDKVLDVLDVSVDQIVDPNNILLKEMGETPVLQGLIHSKGGSILILNIEYIFKPSQPRVLSEVANAQSMIQAVLDSADALQAPELVNRESNEKATPNVTEAQPRKSAKNRSSKTVTKAKITKKGSS